MVNELWGINGDYVRLFFPSEARADTDGPITTAALDEMISISASHVNGILDGAGFDIPSLAAKTGSPVYNNVRSLILEVLQTYLLPAYHSWSLFERQTALDQMRLRLFRVQQNPGILGISDTGASFAPSVGSSTDSLGIDTSEENRKNLREFDDFDSFEW